MIPSPVLVTGGAGFIGANLVRALIDRHVNVHVVVRPSTDTWRLTDVRDQLTWHRVDLTAVAAVQTMMTRVAPAAVVHLAKFTGDPHTLDYAGAYALNLDAARTLLEAARNIPITRFIHAGSSLEYDLSRSPLREDDASVPLTVHGVTKRAGTLLAQHYAVRHAVPAVVLRLFTAYGPWESPARFVPRAIASALTGQPLSVTLRPVVHDWIHVFDVVDAILQALVTEGLHGQVLNIATGRQSTNDEVIAGVEAASGRRIVKAALQFPARPWDNEQWVADVTRARSRLHWTAKRDLAAGLADTCAWFRNHASHYAGALAR